MSVNKKLFEKGDYGVAGDTEARTPMKGANPDLANTGDNGFQKLDYSGGSSNPTPTAPVAVKDPTPKPKPKPATNDPAPETPETPETPEAPEGGGDPKLGLAGIPWKQIAIVAGAAALIAALVALFKNASKSIKLRYNKSVKTLARMQKDFTMSKKGLDMRAVLPGIGSRLNDFFTRVFSGSAFNNNDKKGIMGRKSDRKYKDGVIGLYPFCGRYEDDIDNDYMMAQSVFSKIKLAADQQEASGGEESHTDESYNGKPVYKSFKEAFAAGQLYESADGKPLNESVTALTLAALAPAVIRGGMFVVNKYKENKDGKREKVEGGETAVQVTKESTREMCYAIMNAFFEKYISFEQVSKKMGIDVQGLSDIDNSTIDKFTQVLRAYSNPDAGSATKQYSKVKAQYKKMCNHYFNIGNGVISNFKKYTKAEDEKHENLLVAANEKLTAMWDEQRTKYDDLFPYVLNEIIGHSHYQDYIDFIIEDVIPVFRSGIAGDADYILDVMPKKGDLFLLRQTAQGKDVGNRAIVEITKEYSAEHKNLEIRFIGLYKGKVDYNDDNSVWLSKWESDLDKGAYGKKPILLTYQKFMALDPRIIANAEDFITAKPTAVPKKTAEKKQEYFIPKEVLDAIPELKNMIAGLSTQVKDISTRQDQLNGAVVKITDVLGENGDKFKAEVVALVTDKANIEKQDDGEGIVTPVKVVTEPSGEGGEKPVIVIHNDVNINNDKGSGDGSGETGSDQQNDDATPIETSVEIPVEELQQVESQLTPVEPIEENEQDNHQDSEDDPSNAIWTSSGDDGYQLTVVPYSTEEGETKFAVGLKMSDELGGEKKYLNISYKGDVDWNELAETLKKQLDLSQVKKRWNTVNAAVNDVKDVEVTEVDSYEDIAKTINDFVYQNTKDAGEGHKEDYNKYYFWGGRKNLRGESYVAHICVRPVEVEEGEMNKVSRVNVFMALRSDGDDLSTLGDDSVWSDAITFKTPLNMDDVVNVLKSSDCDYLRECNANTMKDFDEGLYNYIQEKDPEDVYDYIVDAEELKGEDVKNTISFMSTLIGKVRINQSTSGAYVKLDDEHFITILPAINKKGTDIIGLKCSYNNSRGDSITNALFSLTKLDRLMGKKGDTGFISWLEDEYITVGEQNYNIEVISNVDNQKDEAIKKAFNDLKNVSDFDNKKLGISSKINNKRDAFAKVSEFIKNSIGQIGKEQSQKDIVNFLADYCTEIVNNVKVEPLNQNASIGQDNTNASTGQNTDSPAQQETPAQGNDANASTGEGEHLSDSLKEEELDEKKEQPTTKISLSTDVIREHTHLRILPRTQDTLLVSFDVNAIVLQQKNSEPTELSVQMRFIIEGAGTDVDGKSGVNLTKAIVSIPTISRKNTLSVLIQNTAEETGKLLAEAIVKLSGEMIKLRPQENPKGEALNDSIRESIKFNVSYEANDKVIESAAYNTGVTRRITADKDASKYYVISECMWSCANDAATKKALVSKLTSAIKKDPTKYGLMEYAKANDNVELSKNFANMSYSVKKPGNLHSIIGCSLFECAIAVKFNEHDNISNAIAIGVNKIY